MAWRHIIIKNASSLVDMQSIVNVYWEFCLNRKLLFLLSALPSTYPTHLPPCLPYPLSLLIGPSFHDFIRKFKFGGMNRPFSLPIFPFLYFSSSWGRKTEERKSRGKSCRMRCSASCCIFLLFLPCIPCHFYHLSLNNNCIYYNMSYDINNDIYSIG